MFLQLSMGVQGTCVIWVHIIGVWGKHSRHGSGKQPVAPVLLPPSHGGAKSLWPVSLPAAGQQVAGEVMARASDRR